MPVCRRCGSVIALARCASLTSSCTSGQGFLLRKVWTPLLQLDRSGDRRTSQCPLHSSSCRRLSRSTAPYQLLHCREQTTARLTRVTQCHATRPLFGSHFLCPGVVHVKRPTVHRSNIPALMKAKYAQMHLFHATYATDTVTFVYLINKLYLNW